MIMRAKLGTEELKSIFYHRTAAAEAILREGFRDAEGSYMLVGMTLRGVFVSNVPLDCNEGAKGDQLLEVSLTASCDISDYEQIEEGKGHREWCVPAEIINRYGTVRLLSEEPDDIDRFGKHYKP
jgi:hypothetical protein